MGRKLIVGLGTVLALSSLSKAGEVEITGPTSIRPDTVYNYSLMARNDDVAEQQTRSIDWRVTGTSELEISSPVKPNSQDFFSDDSWNPYTTKDTLMSPPIPSARYTWNSSDLVENKPWSNVAHYSVQVSPSFSGPFPADATIGLPNNDLIFLTPDLAEDPNVINLTPTYDVTVLPPLGDLSGNGTVDIEDVSLFSDVLLGYSVNPSDVDTADINRDGFADGRDIQPFLERIVNGS